MVLRMIISEKWIHINSYDVCFDYNVKSVIILKQKIIVQLEIGDLYAVDMAGNIIEKNNKPFQRSDLDKDSISCSKFPECSNSEVPSPPQSSIMYPS